jgi:hypothetical protein
MTSYVTVVFTLAKAKIDTNMNFVISVFEILYLLSFIDLKLLGEY